MIVLDTHVIIWDALQPNRLSKPAKRAIAKANLNDGIIFCDISLWEIGILIQKKQILVNTSYLEFIQLILASNRYLVKPISPEIAELATSFPATLSKDPADRLIAATAVSERAQLVTADARLRNAPELQTIW